MEQQLKILLLEDSPVDAELIQRLVRKAKDNCQFLVAGDRHAFIEGMKDFSPDVIISDNSLPQFNSADALAIVRERDRHVPFILVTGTVSEEYAADIIRQGADDYILKDRMTRLPSAIDNAIRRRKSEKEKSLALEQLISSEVKYRNLIESISDGFLAMDRDWHVTYINSVAEEMLQKPAGYLLGRDIKKEFPQAVDGAFFKGYEQAIRTGHNVHVEEYSKVLDRWVYASAYPSPAGVSIFFRDITEQRKAEEEAKQNKEKYQVFIERITDAFISLDTNWRYTYLNKQAGELIRRNPDELVGKNVWEVFPEAVGSSTYHAFHKAMDEQHYVSNVDYFEPLDLWQENHIYPSKDGVSVFIRNITEKKKLEIKLHEQERQEQMKLITTALDAQEKERNSIGIELHDNVNQILVGTKLMMTLLKNAPGKNMETLEACIENIQQAIDENRKIAHELVSPDLSNLTLLQQLTDLSTDMLETIGISVTISSDDFDENLLTPHQQLTIYRVAQEQCTNIVKYSKAQAASFSLSTANNVFTMIIADNGQGMQSEEVTTGIGLRNITARLTVLGGTAQVDTAPGQGFSLKISFPCCGSSEEG